MKTNTQTPRQYRAVFLDWDDTVGDWNNAAVRAQKVIYDEHLFASFAPDFAEWLHAYQTHNTELWNDYAAGKISREFLHIDQFMQPICRFLDKGGWLTVNGVRIIGDEQQEMNERVLRPFCQELGDEYIRLTNEFFSLREGAEELVEYLSKKYPLTIVSNGYVETQYLKLEKSGLKECFAHTIYSEEVGVAKPDARIIDIAIERNSAHLKDLKKEEVVLIGDSYSSDILGAKAAGIDSIWWLRPGCQATAEEEKDATFIVTDIGQIKAIL